MVKSKHLKITLIKKMSRIDRNNKIEIKDIIYSMPPFKLILRSLCSDLTASLLVPYVYLIRWAIMESSKTYVSDVWESVETTKKLRRS